MVALIRPNSATSQPVVAMKRPSEVPPEVESSASIFCTNFIALLRAAANLPLRVKKGLPDKRHFY